MEDVKRLQKIDKDLHEIEKKVSFLDMNPINEDEQRKKFEKDEPITFEYAPLKEDPKKLIEQIDKLDIRYSVMDRVFRRQALRLKGMIRMLEARGSSRALSISEKLYGFPSKSLVTKAQDILIEPLKSKPKEENLSTKQIIKIMNKAFMKFGSNWTVLEKNMTAHAAVLASKRQLCIRKKSSFPKSFVKRLIVHEIGTHVLRAENGSRQPYKIFQYGLPGYMMTEEGLAVYNEEVNQCLSQETLRRYAGRVLAVHKAKTSSFEETYKYLRDYFDEDFSWRTAVRVKRGLKDPSKAGAFTKDHLYLKGYFEVKKFVSQGKDLEKLYYGKVGIEDVPELDKIPGLIHPMYLPFFRYFQFFIEIMHELVKFNLKIMLAPVLYPFDVKNYKKLFEVFRR